MRKKKVAACGPLPEQNSLPSECTEEYKESNEYGKQEQSGVHVLHGPGVDVATLSTNLTAMGIQLPH